MTAEHPALPAEPGRGAGVAEAGAKTVLSPHRLVWRVVSALRSPYIVAGRRRRRRSLVPVMAVGGEKAPRGLQETAMSEQSGGRPKISDEELTALVRDIRKFAATLLDMAAGKFHEGCTASLMKHGLTHDQADRITADTWRQALASKRK